MSESMMAKTTNIRITLKTFTMVGVRHRNTTKKGIEVTGTLDVLRIHTS